MTHNPYINCTLYTTVILNANQYNNDLYNHLKKNLIKKTEGKCYRNYGYIMNIIEIIKFNNGEIPADNPLSSAIFDVEFSCKLCRPIIGKQIVTKIDRMNSELISLINGPIKTIITIDRINKDIFTIDQKGHIKFNDNNQQLQSLSINNYVIITILSLRFNNSDSYLMTLGSLDNIASETEIKKYYENLHSKNSEMLDFNKYLEEINL
jgi:DNA-directed RNA polymerase subunit E'/Rpb7